MGITNLGKLVYNRPYLRDVIFEKLKKAIINGKLQQGKIITELQISKEFGVSRTPVREALYKLTATGLIRKAPNKGFLVSTWSIKEIKDVFEIRIALECLAVKLFIENSCSEDVESLRGILEKMKKAVKEKNFMEMTKMNNNFHNVIIRKSGNSEILHTLEPLKNKINIFRLISISTPTRSEKSLNEHESILDSIVKKDIDSAKKLFEIHIKSSLNVIEKKFGKEKIIR